MSWCCSGVDNLDLLHFWVVQWTIWILLVGQHPYLLRLCHQGYMGQECDAILESHQKYFWVMSRCSSFTKVELSWMARRDPCSSSLGTVVGPLLSTTLDLAGIRFVNASPCSSTARRYEQAPIPSSEASENVCSSYTGAAAASKHSGISTWSWASWEDHCFHVFSSSWVTWSSQSTPDWFTFCGMFLPWWVYGAWSPMGSKSWLTTENRIKFYTLDKKPCRFLKIWCQNWCPRPQNGATFNIDCKLLWQGFLRVETGWTDSSPLIYHPSVTRRVQHRSNHRWLVCTCILRD